MTKERIEDIVTRLGNSVAETLGYELVDVEYKKEGSDWILRCFIDCLNGVGINECQLFSEAIEKILDAEDPIPGSYLLEVSSPGLERPLKKEADFQRFTGQQVEMKLHRAINGQKKYQGELLGFNGTDKLITIKTGNTNIEIPLQDIAKANLVADFFGIEGGKKGQ